MSVKIILHTTSEEISKIKKCYGINNEDLSNDVQHLRHWLTKQAHLPQDMKDEYLQKLLVINKFSLEKTKQKIDMFYSVRSLVPEFFDDRNLLSPKMQHHMDIQIFTPLPKLTNDFSRVHFFTYMNNSAENFDLLQHIKYCFANADVRLFFDDCVSDTYLIDMKNCTIEHVLKHNPVIIKKAVTIIEKAYSDRLKGLHVINLPNYANVLVTMAKTFLNQKIAERVHIHKNLESLHKCISKSILPIEYGGTEKSIHEIYKEWRTLLESNNKWIVEISQKKSNEKLRTGPAISSDIFGSIHGSFRQLNLD